MAKTINLAVLTVSAVLSVFAVTGCGTAAGVGGVATAGGGDATSTAVPGVDPAADPIEAERQLARCMRDNGVDWPDPGPTGVPADFDPTTLDQTALNAGLAACQQFMLSGDDLPAPTPEDLEADRQVSQCMREKGFPLPDAVGDQVLDELPGIDANSPEFRAAYDTCNREAYTSATTGGNG